MVVRAVISDEFWARMRVCCSNRAWRVGSRDAGAWGKGLLDDCRDGAIFGGGCIGLCVKEEAGGAFTDGAIVGGGGGGGCTGFCVKEEAGGAFRDGAIVGGGGTGCCG